MDHSQRAAEAAGAPGAIRNQPRFLPVRILQAPRRTMMNCSSPVRVRVQGILARSPLLPLRRSATARMPAMAS